MNQSSELQKRRSVEQRFHAALLRLHDETGCAAYAAMSCPANFRSSTIPVFMLITNRDGAATSLRVSRDFSRSADPYRIHIREHGRNGLQRCSAWQDEEGVTSSINELLMLVDHGDLGHCSWMHFGQNMITSTQSGLISCEREPLSLMSFLTAS